MVPSAVRPRNARRWVGLALVLRQLVHLGDTGVLQPGSKPNLLYGPLAALLLGRHLHSLEDNEARNALPEQGGAPRDGHGVMCVRQRGDEGVAVLGPFEEKTVRTCGVDGEAVGA